MNCGYCNHPFQGHPCPTCPTTFCPECARSALECPAIGHQRWCPYPSTHLRSSARPGVALCGYEGRPDPGPYTSPMLREMGAASCSACCAIARGLGILTNSDGYHLQLWPPIHVYKPHPSLFYNIAPV